MRFSQFATIIGFTTTAFLAIAPIRVEAATIYQVKSGVTSIDRDHEQILKNIGLIITDTNNTVTPNPPDYLVGLGISSDSTLRFSDDNGLTYLSGTIEHTGTITFNNTTTVGNFSIGSAPERNGQDSGFVLRDTVSPGELILFDLSVPNPESVSFDSENLTLSVKNINLLFSPEFAAFLGRSDLAGTFAGTARIDAKVAVVPEGDSALAILAAGAAVLAVRFYSRKVKYT